MTHAPTFPGFRAVPRTGVIYVMTEARKVGYQPGHPSWANFGQGAPETGEIPGSPARITRIELPDDDHEYAPIAGLDDLRDAVAQLYNERYRQGLRSQYTRENVSISAGGRTALTRLVTSLGRTNVGHFLPDYTAYEELLGSFGTFVSIPLPLDPKNQFGSSVEHLESEILGRGLSLVLFSNPCNPTGSLVSGSQLEDWVSCARKHRCMLVADEFYSHYIHDRPLLSVSLTEFVEDVNEDPVVIVDGLTKNWRYPGWRIAWTVGPRDVIDSIASAGSFIDGGCARPMQKAAIALVNRETADQEARAIQDHFARKRSYLCMNLQRLGIEVNPMPAGGFYCWGDLRKLGEELDTGMKLFRRALEKHVITVPGEFFDIDPGRRRAERPSRFRHFTRFSFGPPQDELERGIAGLEALLGA